MESDQIILFGLLTLSLSVALATDQSSLQDFCVADQNSRGTTTFFVFVFVLLFLFLFNIMGEGRRVTLSFIVKFLFFVIAVGAKTCSERPIKIAFEATLPCLSR
jgi:hypothetical protein